MKFNTMARGSLALVASLILAGCGSNGGPSGDPELPDQNISGMVMDPAISGALVTLCESKNLDRCLQNNADRTDAAGGFAIGDIDGDVNLSSYLAVSKGGIDVETGVSFEGLAMTAPTDLLVDGKIIISPLSSMLHANEWNLSALASHLGIDESDIAKDPTTDPKLQRISLLLAAIAKERGKQFSDIAIMDGDFTAYLSGTDTGISAEDTQLLQLMSDYLQGDTAAKDISRYNALRILLESMAFSQSTKDDIARENIRKWADAIMGAAAGAGIEAPNLIQTKALFLITPPDINISSSDFNLTSADLNVSLISGFANLSLPGLLIDHTVALSEALGEDDASGTKMRNYYFGSTASYLYQAEALITGMNDVSLTDELYARIAKGYIENGMIDRALSYAQSSIFTKEVKADVYRAVGEALIGTDNARAEKLLDDTFALYKEVTDAKGAGNMKNTDIFDYRYLYADYIQIGNDSKKNEVADYIEGKSNDFTTSTQWGSFQVGLYDAAKEQLEAGKTADAIATLHYAYDFAQNIPPNNSTTKPESKQYYKAKIFAYGRIALLLAEAGDPTKAIEVADAAQAIRADDGLDNSGNYETGKKTEIYVGMYLVPAYVTAGNTDKAVAAIDTVSKAAYKKRCFIEYAKGLALTSADTSSAFVVVDDNISDYDDKITALTYNGKNKKGDYIAQALIERGESAKAKEAIDKAVSILDAAVAAGEESSDKNIVRYYVTYGYAKLANLYANISEESLADTNFDTAKAILDNNVSDAKYKIPALAQMIDYLYDAQRDSQADSYIGEAKTMADALDTKKKLAAYKEILGSKNDIRAKKTDADKPVADAMLSEIRTADGLIGESTDDKNYKKSVEYLLRASSYATDSQAVMRAAVTYAKRINSTSGKTMKLKDISEQYAKLGMIDKAKELIEEEINFAGDKREAIADIANVARGYDAFPQSDIATVDMDGDGKPDFFDKGATQAQIDASGLELDDDNDADEILNRDDLMPFNP